MISPSICGPVRDGFRISDLLAFTRRSWVVPRHARARDHIHAQRPVEGRTSHLARTEREKSFPAYLNTCPPAAADDYAPILRIRTIGVSFYLSTSTQWR